MIRGRRRSGGRGKRRRVLPPENPEGLREDPQQRCPLHGWASQDTRQSKLRRKYTLKGSSHQKQIVAMFSCTGTMFTETMINAWTMAFQIMRSMSCGGGYMETTATLRRGVCSWDLTRRGTRHTSAHQITGMGGDHKGDSDRP